MFLNICVTKSPATGGLSPRWAVGGHSKVCSQEEFAEVGSLGMG